MLAQNLLSVLLIVSIGRANSLHLLKQFAMSGTENHGPLRIFVYEDSEDGPDIVNNDARRLFLLSHTSTPTEERMNGGTNLFGIPMGPQISYIKDKDEREDTPMAKGEAMNGEGYETNHQQEIFQVPAKDLRPQLVLTTAYVKNPGLHTFPWKYDPRKAIGFADQSSRRNEKLSAGVQLFGVPVGPQFTYDKVDGQGQNVSGLNPGTVAETYSIDTPIMASIEELAEKFVRQLIEG